MIHDSHWDTTSLWISIGLFILFSNSFSEEFALSNCGTLPYVNSLFYPEEWYEEKCAYDKVLVGLVWSEYAHVGLILFFSSAEICVSRKTFFWLKYFSNEFYMRLITTSMNNGLFKLGTRELDCVELPAQNGIVQTLATLYHCVHICSVSHCQTSLGKECSRGYKTVHSLGAKEKMWTRCPLVPEN